MRAIAVLLVVASHAQIKHILGGGYVGVDVFFVISGFLITGVLAREVRSTGRVSFAKFYSRRAGRILPAASAVLLLIMLASTVVYTDGHLGQVAKDVVWAAFFGANLHFAQGDTGYFAINSFETPVQHFWSLAVEEQFYLVWPALIALMIVVPWHRRAGRARAVRATEHRTALRRAQALRRAAALIALLSVVCVAWSAYDTVASPLSAYYSTFTRGWELGLGSLLALGAHRLGRLPMPLKAAMSWIGLAAILLAGVEYTSATPFPGVAALLPVLGAVLMIAGGTDGPRYGATLLLGLRPMRFIGDISYSLYLVHWPVLILAEAYAGHPLRIRVKLALVVVSIVLAWTSCRWVETPFRLSRRLRRGNLRALALWPSALVAVLVPTMLVYQSTVAQVPAVATTQQKKAMDEAPATLRGHVVASATKAHQDAPLPAALIPTLVNLPDDGTEPPDECWSSTAAQIGHRICPMGDTSSSTTVVVWGDSHAAQWLKPLGTLARKHHVKLIPLIKAACLPADVTVMFHGKQYAQCDAYRQWALEQIRHFEPKLVIISGLLTIDLVDPATHKPAADAKGTSLFRAGAKRTLQRLHELAPAVDVISDQAQLPQDAETCLGSRTATMATCAQPVNTRAEKRDHAWSVVAKETRSTYLDMQPWLCAKDVCPIVIDNAIVYRDNQHLTTTYVERLAPVLAAKLPLESL